MKKVLSLVLMMATTAIMFAQADVVSAYNANKNGDYAKAAEYIDKAITQEKASVKEKTWRYRGEIYANIAASPELAPNYPEALTKSKDSYFKAMDLDKKGSYNRENQAGLDRVRIIASNTGVENYSTENYGVAGQNFLMASELGTYFGITDSVAIFNAAISFENAGMNQEAIDQYLACGDISYNVPDVYMFASYLYRKMEDNDKAKEIIMSAREKYPENKELIIEELNFYLESGDDDLALENLALAVQKDPENKVLYFAQGTILDKMEKKDEAIASYERAIELDGNYFDALYNLGAFYFNEGVSMVNDANEIVSNTQYKAAIEEANATFAKGIPYLEKAHEVNPTDKDTLKSLKDAYARVGDDDKYNEVKEKLDALN